LRPWLHTQKPNWILSTPEIRHMTYESGKWRRQGKLCSQAKLPSLNYAKKVAPLYLFSRLFLVQTGHQLSSPFFVFQKAKTTVMPIRTTKNQDDHWSFIFQKNEWCETYDKRNEMRVMGIPMLYWYGVGGRFTSLWISNSVGIRSFF